MEGAGQPHFTPGGERERWQRLLTAATLLAGAGALPVVAAVFTGKLIWFGMFLGVLIRAPQVLERVPVLGRGLERFARFRSDVPAARSAPH